MLAGAFEHFEVDVHHGIETSAKQNNRSVIECFGRLDDFAIGHEHCRVGEPALHELQGAEAVVEEAVSMAAEFQKIDLYPAGVEVVGERLRKLTEVVVVAVAEVLVLVLLMLRVLAQAVAVLS